MINSLRHTNDSDGRDLARREYWRDNRDRILAWKRGTDTLYNGMEDGRGNRYHYDDEGELDLADYRAQNPETATPTDPKRRDTFNYDALGNRAGGNHVANLGDVNFTRRDNGLNQYLDWTPSAIYHDDNYPASPSPSPWPLVPPGNGVVMADGWLTASFNALNQPMAMWCWTYGQTSFQWFGYDPLGRCVKRWMGSATGNAVNSNVATYYYYDGWNLVQEGPNASAAARTYVHGGRVDEIVASQVDGLWYNHHYDAQGNCIMLTAGTQPGAIQEQYDYDAFGLPYLYTPSGGRFTSVPHTRFLFTGREWLSDLRIYDYRARQYQPELGRFLQPDPKEFGAGDYNLYRYCHNDAVNKSDPTGLLERDKDTAHLEQQRQSARWNPVASNSRIFFSGRMPAIQCRHGSQSRELSMIRPTLGLIVMELHSRVENTGYNRRTYLKSWRKTDGSQQRVLRQGKSGYSLMRTQVTLIILSP